MAISSSSDKSSNQGSIGCLLDLLQDKERAVNREEAALSLLFSAEESLKDSSTFALPLGLSGER